MSYERLNLLNGAELDAEHIKHLEDGIAAALDAAEKLSDETGDRGYKIVSEKSNPVALTDLDTGMYYLEGYFQARPGQTVFSSYWRKFANVLKEGDTSRINLFDPKLHTANYYVFTPNSFDEKLVDFDDLVDASYVETAISSLTKKDLDMKGYCIVNIGPGMYDLDAVNKGQLDTAMSTAVDTAVKDTIDKTCPSFSESGRIVTCEPVEGYPLQVGWSSKNLLKNTAQSQTINGVTFTVNDDGSITVSGTATADAYVKVGATTLDAGAKYTLSGCPSGGSTTTYALYIAGAAWFDLGNSVSFVADGSEYAAWIKIGSGYNASDLLFKPMIRLEGTDAAYEPYAEAPTAITRCGKNLLPYPYSSGIDITNFGIRITCNADGSITLNGTATGDVYYFLKRGFTEATLPPGRYCISTAGRSTMGIQISSYKDGTYVKMLRTGEGAFTVDYSTYDSLHIFLFCASGKTVDEIIYPQLELGSAATAYEAPAAQTFSPGEAVPALPGVNTVFADTGLVTVTGRANPAPIINDLQTRLAAIEAAIVGNTENTEEE